MSVDVFPQSVQGAGTMRVQFVPVLANPKQPTLVELNANDAFNATPYFRADAFQIDHAQARIDDTRLSDESTRETFGISTFTLADALAYIHNPQATSNAPGNKAYATFVAGLTGYIVLRYGTKQLLSAAPFATTQRIGGVFSVTFGDRHKPIPVGDNASHLIRQNVTLAREAEDWLIPSA